MTTTVQALALAEAAELAGRLAEEMTARWQQGERVGAEEFLARHPALRDQPEAAADLIYEELCLRQEFDAEIPVEDVLARYPQWRRQLTVLLNCQSALGPRPAVPALPSAGAMLGDFLLLQELGRGGSGRVFLSTQVSLGDRPVVLKVVPLAGHEHLSLARLQHTYIVPLYSVHDDPVKRLRALCMPFFGGRTLAQLLEAMRATPVAERTGAQIADLLEQAEPRLRESRQGLARQALASATYVEAICWLGICLTEALQYAHERGLVHLDIKPSNILWTLDGQPMLLDFHLARAPIQPAEPALAWLGGTCLYMSPEQEQALAVVRDGGKVVLPVDGRSDLYSLGIVLFEALGGRLPSARADEPLQRANPAVSRGLADIVARCLAADAKDRYPNPAALAQDLRRHLEHRPLTGVRNRSVRERWQKWRARRPQRAALLGMMGAVVAACFALGIGAYAHFQQQREVARLALHQGRLQLDSHQPDLALATLEHGLLAARSIPFARELVDELSYEAHQAEVARTVQARADLLGELHQIAEQARYLYGTNNLAPSARRELQDAGQAVWRRRALLLEYRESVADDLREQACEDLFDVAIFLADVSEASLEILTEAEQTLGPSPVLAVERRRHGDDEAPSAAPARTAWESYALGRALLRAGSAAEARLELDAAIRLQPRGLWPNFYRGQCAMQQGRYEDALLAFSVCVGAAPHAAGFFRHRALAFAALERMEEAERDRSEAVRLASQERRPRLLSR